MQTTKAMTRVYIQTTKARTWVYVQTTKAVSIVYMQATKARTWVYTQTIKVRTRVYTQTMRGHEFILKQPNRWHEFISKQIKLEHEFISRPLMSLLGTFISSVRFKHSNANNRIINGYNVLCYASTKITWNGNVCSTVKELTIYFRFSGGTWQQKCLCILTL
jgi:hypothetical protein